MLKKLDFKGVYSTEDDDLLNDFYIPALKSSIKYDRAVGYFSSRVFFIAGQGLTAFIKNNGKIRLLIGATLSTTDKDISDTHKYFIQRSNWGDNNSFKISGNKLIIKDNVNYSKKWYYNVNLLTVDNNGRSFEKNFLIKVSREKFGPTNKTYSISVDSKSVTEGDSFKTTIKTKGLSYYDPLYWSISGKGIDSNDFTYGKLLGSSYARNGSKTVQT